MLRISKMADYSIVILASIDKNCSDENKTSNVIAKVTGIPHPTVAKLLLKMSKYGFIEATRGQQGGYKIIKSLDKITLKEIIEVIDGEVSITECSTQLKKCKQEEMCDLKGPWQQINLLVTKVMNVVTLKMLINNQLNKLKFVLDEEYEC